MADWYYSFTGSVPDWRAKIASLHRASRPVYAGMTAWLGSHSILLFAGYLLLKLDPRHATDAAYTTGLTWPQFINTWHGWDGGWYVDIARFGYSHPNEAGYFPLYPLLIHELAHGGMDAYLAAWLIAALSSLVACIALAMIAQDAGVLPHVALRVWLSYPFAFWLVFLYSESLFFALVFLAILAARRRWWVVAFASAFFAGTTRPFGIMLAAPLLWEYGWQQGWWNAIARHFHERRWPRQFPVIASIQGMVIGLAAPLGLGVYSLYWLARSGDPLQFIHAQDFNGHAFLPPWSALGLAWQQWSHAPLGSEAQVRIALDLLPFCLCLAGTLFLARRLAMSDVLYLIGLNVIILLTPTPHAHYPDVFVSASRYCIGAFPLFLWLAKQLSRHTWLEMYVVGGGIAIQIMLVVFLINGGWLV